MKKIFFGSLVGGILIFIWQFLSWYVLELHRPAYDYTPKQESILEYLNTQFDSSGGYLMPSFPKGASTEERETNMKDAEGKPWVQLSYHTSLNTGMGMNMAKNLVTNILMVILFCWIISGYAANSFGKTFLAAIFTGLIVFFHGVYTQHIWYETFDLGAHLADYLVSWGLTGIWLGWWLNRRKV
jgi:hypothetical protein